MGRIIVEIIARGDEISWKGAVAAGHTPVVTQVLRLLNLVDVTPTSRNEATDRAALINAGCQRLRPIRMTSLNAISALMPLAWGTGTESTMKAPLAIAIIWGLVAAVRLVLVVMPTV